MSHLPFEIVIRLVVVVSVCFSSFSPLLAQAASNRRSAGYLGEGQAAVPVAAFSADSLSGNAPLDVAFSNNSTAATLYEWDFGDGTGSTEASPNHTYGQSGVYTVTLQAGATLSGTGGTVTDTLTLAGYITVSEPAVPVAAFSADPVTGDAPLTVAFSNISTAATLYEWDFGDGTTSSEATPDHIYSQSGVYTVTLQAGDGTVTDTLTLTDYITVSEPAAPLPQADFAASPMSGTAPLTVTFTNNSTNASVYEWDFGDGVSSFILPPSSLTLTHVYTAGGVYTISLRAGNGVVTDTLTRTAYLTVTDVVTPVAAFSADPLSGTAPLTVTFSNNSVNAGQYLWDFGDGATSTEANPGHTYSQSGLYTVTLQAGVTLPGSGEVVTDTLRQAGYIEVVAPDTPQPDFSASPVSGMLPLTVTFTNNSTNADRYVWDFGDGTSTFSLQPSTLTETHSYTQAGVYTVSLQAGDTLSGTGGVVTRTLSRANYITVTAPVTAEFSVFPQQGTLPLLVQFLNTSGGTDSYVWDFGDGTGSIEASPSHTYSQSGVYTVSLQAGSTLVTGTLTRTGYITVTDSGHPALAIGITAPATVTAGEPITYTLTVTNSGNVTASNVVITNALPANATYVSGGSLAGRVVSWPAGSLTPGTSVSVDLGVTASTTITNSDYGATAAGGVVVTGVEPVVTLVTAPLVVDFSAFPHQAAAPTLVQFLDNSSGSITTYAWDFGDGLTSTLASPTHTYSTTGVYSVSLTISSPTDSATLTRPNYISVTQPTTPLTVDFNAFPQQGTLPLLVQFLNNSSGATGYAWDFGDGLTSTLASPTHTYVTAGTYTVTLTALDAGGRTPPVSRSRAITVRPAVMPLIGQPARVQIAVKRSVSPGNPIKPGGPQSETDYWLAVTVLDAGGQAVADGTPVNVTVQGGQVGRSQLQTRHGIASVQFKATAGQSVSITASAGSAQ